MHTFKLKLKEIKQRIKKWNKEEFGNILKDQEELKNKIETVQLQIIAEGKSKLIVEEEGQLIMQLEERWKQEEILWKQQYGVN